jgi:hypothetical protein
MIERSFKLKPSITGHWTAGIAYAYVRMGNKKKALEIAPSEWAVLLALGMKEEAIKAMPYYNETDNQTSTFYLLLNSQKDSKEFEPIRNDPRFLKIFEKAGKYMKRIKRSIVLWILSIHSLHQLPDTLISKKK